jgi:hypothetical protein
MKKTTLAFALTLLVASHAGAAGPDDQWVTTTLIRLLADPVSFHKSNVLVKGFLQESGGSWYVCYSTEAWKLDAAEGGVLLYHPRGGLFVPNDARLVSGTPVMVSGRLEIAGGTPMRKGQALRLYLVLSAEHAVRPFTGGRERPEGAPETPH